MDSNSFGCRSFPIALALLAVVTACGPAEEPAAVGDCETPPETRLPTTIDSELTGLSADLLWDSPEVVGAAVAPKDSLVVALRTGKIVHWSSNESVAPLIDLGAHLTSEGPEQGLLSVLVSTKGDLIVTVTDRSDDVVVANLGSWSAPKWPQKTLLRVEKSGPWHNGGRLLESAPGKLIVGIGDDGTPEGSPGPAQDPTSPIGKILTLDLSGRNDPEVVATGLRNPWGMALHNRHLWVADVGQFCSEEINRFESTSRPNLGWPHYEGSIEMDGLDVETTPPLYEYPHGPHCAIVGGVVYKGTIAALEGRFVFGDYCTGELFAIDPNGTSLKRLPVGSQGLTWIGEDATGELLFASDADGLFRVVDDQ